MNVPTPFHPIRTTAALLPNDTALHLGCLITAHGPLTWPALHGHLNSLGSSRPLTDRGVRFSLDRLRRLGLITHRRSGPQGIHLYTALPKLRRLLDAAEITLETFAAPSAPGPSAPSDGADGPESLGL